MKWWISKMEDEQERWSQVDTVGAYESIKRRESQRERESREKKKKEQREDESLLLLRTFGSFLCDSQDL